MNVAKIEKLLWPAGRADAPVAFAKSKVGKADKLKNLRKVLDAGELNHVDRRTWHKVIEARAAKIQKAGETPEQAYARAILEDPESVLCFKAY